jgi:hypothetical protein
MVIYVTDIFRWYFPNIVIFRCYETNFPNRQQKNCTEPKKGKKGNSNLAKEAQQRKESWSFWTTESLGL